MRLALLNMSSAPNDQMALIAAALRLYLIDVCAAWEHAPIDIAFYLGQQVAPIGWSPLIAFEQPDQPNLEGYHDVDEQDRPYGRAFRACVPGGQVLHDPAGAGASLAGVLTHEAAEMARDLLANEYQDGPFVDPTDGKSYAMVATELADPVQELAYPIVVDGQPVDASNFIYPAWFDRRAKGVKFDHMGKLTAPLTLAPGGYAIVRGGADESQVFARAAARKAYHERRPAPWREAMKLHRGGRTRRRLAR